MDSKGKKLPEFEDLQAFVRVVALQSMTAAARELGLAPAVVSKRIGRLEKNLGARLFQRSTRQLVVTEIGEGFHVRALNILASIEEAHTFASGRSSIAAGSLKVAAPTSFGRMHIAPHLPQFMDQHPHLAINLVLSDALSDLIADGFDLAIRIGELKDSTLVARKICTVERVLCAAPSYLEKFGQPETIDTLVQHRCLPAHNDEPWRLDGPLGSLTYRPTGMLKTNSSEVIREAVLGGLGIALRSTWDIGHELAQNRLVRVLPDYQGSRDASISAVYPSRQFLPFKVRIFIEYLQGVYGANPTWTD